MGVVTLQGDSQVQANPLHLPANYQVVERVIVSSLFLIVDTPRKS